LKNVLLFQKLCQKGGQPRMNKGLALLFAICGTALLTSISYSISIGNVWLVLLFSIVSLLFIGFGFIVKARQRRKRDGA
jgi:uncharacterized membrane protein